MCHRVVCQDCGKFTWEGCGLHIAQALAGLTLEQICRCDDDRDSEHSWATISAAPPGASMTFASTTTALQSTTRYPLSDQNTSAATATTAIIGTCHDDDNGSSTILASGSLPATVEYKLSKISSTSATEAAIRMAQQAAALEELKRRKQEKDRELKLSNQGALSKLLLGLSEATEAAPDENDNGSKDTNA
ncbi:hypothetical protein FBU30_006152 [Linnemannia zychae]|nr:hypothetical protein FBU30_006152 [Linnemannia zychae]